MSELNTAISTPMDMTDYKAMSSVKVSRVSIQPENTNSVELLGGNTSDVYFSIPSKGSTFLAGANSYLSFTYRLKGSTQPAVAADPTATPPVAEVAAGVAQICSGTGASFIRNLETIAGSTSLELIQDYNAVACLVDDFQPANRKIKLGSILEDASTTQAKQGQSRSIAATTADGFTEKRRICLPLISMVMGTTGDNYYPLNTDTGLRLRLTFEDPLIALKSNLTTDALKSGLGYILEDITYEAEYLTTDPSTYNAIVREAGGVMKVSGTGVSSFQTTVQAGSTKNTILVPARYSSVRNYFTMMRPSNDVGGITAATKNSTGCRVRDNLEAYQYRIHGVPYPNLPVSVDAYTGAEAMCEVLKCFHSLHNTAQDIVVDKNYYTQNTSSDVRGAFVFGIDFQEAGFSSQSMSGLSTNSGNTFIEMTHTEICSDLTINTFCFFDQVIEIDTNSGEIMVSK